MTKTFLYIATILASTVCLAGPHVSEGPGPVQTYAECSGQLDDGTDVTFEVRATAAVGIVDSVLLDAHSNYLFTQLLCQPGSDLIPGTPSAGSIEWNCSDYGNTRSGYSVQLERGGFTGITTGEITLNQMYPLPPKAIGTLVCK